MEDGARFVSMESFDVLENFKNQNYLIIDMCSMTTMKMLSLVESESLDWKEKSLDFMTMKNPQYYIHAFNM